MSKENIERVPSQSRTRAEQILNRGIMFGDVGGVVLIIEGFLRGSVTLLGVGVGLTSGSLFVAGVKEVAKKRRSKN